MSFTGVSFIGDGGGSSRSSSAITGATASGYHLLVVDGYSRTKQDTPNGECVESRPFRLGGHTWFIEYYPNGKDPEVADYISLFLVLDDDAVVEESTLKVHFDFSFADEVDKQGPTAVRATEAYGFVHESYWGYRRFMAREALERSKHLKDDSFTIRCDVVIASKRLSAQDAGGGGAPPRLLAVPPSDDLHRHFGDLMRTMDGADEVFEVGGRTFTAHRCILAARSSVFRAQFFGSTKDAAATWSPTSITHIDDMEANVFKALLTFIYTDSLLVGIEMEERGGQEQDDQEMEEAETDAEKQEDNTGMWQKLLVAADRYDLHRLKLMCEQKLCALMDTSTVTAFLMLAQRHHCRGLKEECLNFLRSQANLQKVLEADGLVHVTSTCPSVLEELLAKFASHA